MNDRSSRSHTIVRICVARRVERETKVNTFMMNEDAAIVAVDCNGRGVNRDLNGEDDEGCLFGAGAGVECTLEESSSVGGDDDDGEDDDNNKENATNGAGAIAATAVVGGGTSFKKVITSVSTLNLVDLAGSESVRLTNASGMRQKEGGKINQR